MSEDYTLLQEKKTGIRQVVLVLAKVVSQCAQGVPHSCES